MTPPDTDQQQVRTMLAKLNLSQRAAARALEVNERTMRRWCAGPNKVPRRIILALHGLLDLQKADK